MRNRCPGRVRREWIFALCAAAATLVRAAAPPPCRGDDPQSQRSKSQRFLLTGQEPAEPFVPLVPRTIEDTTRLEAIKQFCIGRWLENQNRWSDAIVAYRKALEHDPRSFAILQRLIETCNAARRPQDALKYMREAEELAPDDVELLARIGEALEEQGQIEAAIERFERALASPQLDRRSPFVVLLRLKLGASREMLGQFDDAAGHYLSVIDALERPEDYGLDRLENTPPFLKNRAETYERFGNVFRQAKRYDDALHAFRKGQTLAPGSAKFSLKIAQIYLEQEKYEQALEHIERYVRDRTPQGSEAYEMLAMVLDKLGRKQEVLPRIQAAADKDRFNMGLQYFLGTLLEEAGDTDKAKEIFMMVIKNPPDGRVYKSLARIYQKEDRVRDLILLLGDGMEKQLPGRAGIFEATEEQARMLASEPETARKVVETAREIRAADNKRLKLGALYFVAKVAQAARQFDDAIEFFRLCVELRPQAAGFRRELALNLAMAGQLDEAVKTAEQALEQDPDNLEAQYSLARIYDAAGQYAKAAEKYESILGNIEDNSEAAKEVRFTLSNCYVHLGDMDKAEAILEQVLARFPDDATANNDLGYLWADQGKNLEQAQRMIRKALERYAAERQPDQPEKNSAFLDSMGWVLYKLGRIEEARQYLEEAVSERAGADDATIVDHLGDVHMRLRQPAKARELWQKAAKQLEEATGARRDDKRLKEIHDKLKALDEQKKDQREIKRERPQ